MPRRLNQFAHYYSHWFVKSTDTMNAFVFFFLIRQFIIQHVLSQVIRQLESETFMRIKCRMKPAQLLSFIEIEMKPLCLNG